MKTDVLIRVAEKKDIPIIVKFNRLMAKETEQLDLDETTLTRGVTAVLDDPQKGFYLVSEVDGSVGACLMITSPK